MSPYYLSLSRMTTTISFTALLGVLLFSVTGCGSPAPETPTTPDPSSAPVSTPTPTEAMPEAPKATTSPSKTTEGSAKTADETAKAESSLSQSIVMLAAHAVDPFSIALPIQSIEAKSEAVGELSPYYQSLLAASPFVTIKVPPPKEVEPLPSAGGNGTLPTSGGGTEEGGNGPSNQGPVVSPEESLYAALGSINVNGISYKKTAPMAILSLGDSGEGSTDSSTIFVKKGSQLNIQGYRVWIEKITPTTVQVGASDGFRKVSRTLPIADIFGFSRTGENTATTQATGAGSMPTNAPRSAVPSPTPPKVDPNKVSPEDIDQIVKDLLK
ncbi:MAG: hypothetical protein HEQ32_03910 [Vampirovibrio sp.]